MRSSILSVLVLFTLAGGATFKELEPKPELSPREQGFIELKIKDEVFALGQGKKYFMKFPRPEQANFVLVLHFSDKHNLRTYLTRAFDDGREPVTRMIDETAGNDSASVYVIDTSAAVYFWVIDDVGQDTGLRMSYRYAPRWRYTFENKYAEYKQALDENVVDRAIFTAAPGAKPIEGVEFAKEIGFVTARTQVLAGVSAELKGLGSLFPSDIAAKKDTAYLKYKVLRMAVEDEVQFQESYATALGIFQTERSTWGNTRAFLADAGQFADFAAQRDRYPAPLLEKARKIFRSRLADAVPTYEKQLAAKHDARPFVPSPALEPVERLFKALGTVPADFTALRSFVTRYNVEAEAVSAAKERLAEVTGRIDQSTKSPELTFYAGIGTAVRDIKAGIPEPLASSDSRYKTLECTGLVALEIGKLNEQTSDLELLMTTGDLVARDIAAHAWASAETRTRALSTGEGAGSYASVARQRTKLVSWFEEDIFSGVQTATHERLDAFVKLNEEAVENVPALYADSAFRPAYLLTFSSGGASDLARKRSQIDNYIATVRNYQFPEAAIRAIDKGIGRDMGAQAVDRARAIVAHGKMYMGSDKQILSMVSEEDPLVPKSLLRPREYRRVFALPVTSNRHGSNDYVFRIRLQLPSDAQFPVFDVNVKLSKDMAENAGRESWYDEITVNKNPIKNEGRFRITSPTAANDYEAQITPVQMEKSGDTILEVRFKRPAYRMYEISVMAQVPIMKKN